MTDLLSRYAECLFWFGRYTERTTCLARLLEVQTSFDRGRASAATRWAWILTLYDDHERFNEHYDRADTGNVIQFYVSDRDNPGSIVSCIHAARENARTLRSLISTDLWHQVNAFYNRFRNLPPASLSDTRLSQTCQMVKKECYAQLGVAAATLYRDEAWHFYQLGALVERADQMSRLLDVRFAQMRGASQDSGKPLGDFGFWSVLLRSAAAQQAYLRSNAGRRDPASVARFLIFDTGLPRSIALCIAEMDRLVNELRSEYDLRGAAPALERIDDLKLLLDEAKEDDKLIDELHQFNDRVQSSLIELSNELAIAFFGTPRAEIYPEDDDKSAPADRAGGGQSQSQSQRTG
jgi:uncharacterized alpha-E superfamily protein